MRLFAKRSSLVHVSGAILTMVVFAALAAILFLTPVGGASAAQSLAPERIAASVQASATADAPSPVPIDRPAILHVPADAATIQAAVDRAVPGQVILIAPGIYHESVRVVSHAKSHLTIRGEDRDRVILDGHRASSDSYLSNGIYIGRDAGGSSADYVMVENLSVRYYAGNGVFWDHVTGYRGSYLTVSNNGAYGIYAFASSRGQFDHDYTSGMPDSGFYIGQCFPCDALISQVTAEGNGFGYSGTNAGGNLVIRDSIWAHNVAGIVPNSNDYERTPPQRQATITHNVVVDNNNLNAPHYALSTIAFGSGIVALGGDDNLIRDNTIAGHQAYGILVVGSIGDEVYIPRGNTIIANSITDSGLADVAFALPAGPDNCLANNRLSTTLPAFLDVTHACGTAGAHVSGGDVSALAHTIGGFARAGTLGYMFFKIPYPASSKAIKERWKTYPLPPAQESMQESMPGSLLAPPGALFTASWTSGAPQGAVSYTASGGKAVAGVTLTSLFDFLLGLYSVVLPLVIFVGWILLAFADLARRDGLSPVRRYGWMAAVFALPIVGAVAYFVLGRPTMTRGARWMLLAGSLTVWLGMTVLLLILSANISG
jgi:hypothetical protein